MTFLAAAEAVLKSARRSLSTDELTAAALRHGLLHTTGRTPDATMASVLYRYAKSHPDAPSSVASHKERRVRPAGQ